MPMGPSNVRPTLRLARVDPPVRRLPAGRWATHPCNRENLDAEGMNRHSTPTNVPVTNSVQAGSDVLAQMSGLMG